MEDLNATKPQIPGANGKDINGTSDEQGLMQWRMNNPPPQGMHYVPTSTLENGKRVFTVYAVPHDTLKDVRAYDPDESASLGLPKQTSYLTLQDAMSLQELHNKNSGLAEMSKKYQDLVAGDFHPPEDQPSAKAALADDAAAFRFFKANPQYASKETFQTLSDRAAQIHDAFPTLAPQSLEAAKTVAQTKEAQSATTKNYAEADAARANAGSKNDELVVSFDPNYANMDGTKGANVVMPRGQAMQNKLQHYKADPSTINSTVAGFNDVQNKVNMLADVVNSPAMDQVQPELAAAMLAHGKGIEVGAFGTKVDMSRVNESLYAEDVQSANDATKAYVTAMGAAHEAVTQLPRLQTFGKSSRMTQQQMEAAQNMLPQPGDGGDMGRRKLTALQTTLDPLRKQLPHMQGADVMPSWLEKGGGRQVAPPPPAKVHGAYDPDSKQIQWNPL
jgi:hypothetical protein